MDDWPYTLLIYILGLGLIVLEVFIPSGGLIGIGAVLCLGYSLWQLWVQFPWIALVCVVLTAGYVIILVRWGFQRFRMDTNLSDGVATGGDVKEAANNLIGCTGQAVTPLRPAGVARFEGRRYDVVTKGGFVEAGSQVQVIEASGNRILVKPG